jgi:hypothetical protein
MHNMDNKTRSLRWVKMETEKRKRRVAKKVGVGKLKGGFRMLLCFSFVKGCEHPVAD